MSHVISGIAQSLLETQTLHQAPLHLTLIPSSKTPLVQVLWWSTPQVHTFHLCAWVGVLVELISIRRHYATAVWPPPQCEGFHHNHHHLRQNSLFSEIYILYIFHIYVYNSFYIHLSSPLLYITDASITYIYVCVFVLLGVIRLHLRAAVFSANLEKILFI